MLLPDPLQKLISALERLPGIGPKSASRLAFFFLRAPRRARTGAGGGVEWAQVQNRLVPGVLQHHHGGKDTVRDL